MGYRYRVAGIFLFCGLAGLSFAGNGVSTATFQIPNNETFTATDLHVTLSGLTSPNSISAAPFTTSINASPSYDFTGGIVAPGDFSTVTATNTGLLPIGSLFTEIQSYDWTDGGSNTSSTYMPLAPDLFVSPANGGTVVTLDNSTGNSEGFTNLSFVVNGVVQANGGGSVAANSSLQLYAGSIPNNLQLSFVDSTTNVQESVSYSNAPEPGTIGLMVFALAILAMGWRRVSRA